MPPEMHKKIPREQRTPDNPRGEATYYGGKFDVFAVGAMLHIMLTGKPLWQKAVAPDMNFKFAERYGVRELFSRLQMERH